MSPTAQRYFAIEQEILWGRAHGRLPEDREPARRLREGGILVAVDCGDNDALVSRARDLFDAHGAEDVSVMRASQPQRKTA